MSMPFQREVRSVMVQRLDGKTSAWRSGVSKRAVTMVELIFVMAIFGFLISILLPFVTSARKQAKRVVCLSNQREIILAIHAYTHDYAGQFPIAQYFDAANSAFVAWDTITLTSDPNDARPGLIWQYANGLEVQQCPSYIGPSMTSGDPYTGYNYNTTYVGRGQHEGQYLGMGQAPARFSQVRFAGRAALVGDGGYALGANKFMRAPLDGGVSELTVHAGAQAYRHINSTNVGYIDGHGAFTTKGFRKPGASRSSESLLDWPKNAFLSQDDTAYAYR